MQTHYNTTNLSGELLVRSQRKAKTQNEIVLRFFEMNAGKAFTPCEVHSRIGLKCPLTSVRRAITTLTEEGSLIKTSNQREGVYGVLTYTWMLSVVVGENNQVLMF